MKPSFLLLIVLCVLGSCSDNNKVNTIAPKTPSSRNDYSFTNTHEADGYTFSVKSQDGERTTVVLETNGLYPEFQESFTIAGRIKESFMLDVNSDGHKEFYITIETSDDSGNIGLKAYVTNASKSISEATVMDEQLGIRQENSDQVLTESGGLIRRFTVNGKAAEFRYMLMQSEASYLLIPMLTPQ